MSPRLQRLGYWPFISFVFNLCFWRRKFHCGWSTSHGLCQAASLSAMLVLQQAHRAFKNIQVAAENLWEGSGGSSKPVICTDPFVNALTWSYPHGSFLRQHCISPCGCSPSSCTHRLHSATSLFLGGPRVAFWWLLLYRRVRWPIAGGGAASAPRLTR